MRCRVPLSTLAQRLTPATYQGKPSGALGSNYNYAYALSDTVPVGKFWIVLYASCTNLQSSGAAEVGLWVIYPGQLPSSNLSPYTNNIYFFEGADKTFVSNGPPVGPYAIRVDEVTDTNTGNQMHQAEQVMLRSRKLIVPSGCTLMAFGGKDGVGSSGGLGEQLQFNTFYAEFDNDEAVEVVAEVAF